jgi:hypothetical protein
MERTSIVRKCSQCHQEGCNKNKPTCPVNVERRGGPVISVQAIIDGYLDDRNIISLGPSPVRRVRLCALCRREGCCRTNPMCPVKIEIERHKRLAFELAPIRIFIVGVSPIDVKTDLYDHIQDPEERNKQFDKLYRNIMDIYHHERYQYMQRELTYSRAYIEHQQLIQNRGIGLQNRGHSNMNVNVLSDYVTCEGECGICYDKPCNVMLNCKHQVCITCLKGQIKIAERSGKFNCAFCRADIKCINASDAETRKLLLDK